VNALELDHEAAVIATQRPDDMNPGFRGFVVRSAVVADARRSRGVGEEGVRENNVRSS
jgi:L-amino acid N-acyltransferase YncA